jgi:hypothetical protein
MSDPSGAMPKCGYCGNYHTYSTDMCKDMMKGGAGFVRVSTTPISQDLISAIARAEAAEAERKVAWDRMAVHNKDADDAIARAEAERDALKGRLRYYEDTLCCDMKVLLEKGGETKAVVTERVGALLAERDALKDELVLYKEAWFARQAMREPHQWDDVQYDEAINRAIVADARIRARREKEAVR